MARIFHRVMRFGSCRASAFVLAFFFLLGLLSGVSAGIGCGPESVSLMRGLLREDVSIVRLCLFLFLPFLLTCVSWVLDPVFLFPICYGRAFLFGFVHTLFFISFGSAGWLLRWLFLFSDGLSLPLFYFLLSRKLKRRSVGVLLPLLVILIGMVDFYLILPKSAAFLSLQKG